MLYDERDMDVWAKTLYGEARGEPDSGKEAVAFVILNRAKMASHAGLLLGRAGAIAAVCLEPWQFSCWNASDPNRALLLSASPSKVAAERAIVDRVVSGHIVDPTNGADHYHTIDAPSWASSWPPDWALDNPPNGATAMKEVANFGGHVFYNSRLPR